MEEVAMKAVASSFSFSSLIAANCASCEDGRVRD
jgi:hypothetical protein